MKKFISILGLVFSIALAQYIPGAAIKKCRAKEETTTYAKASTLCTLYKSPQMSEEIENIYFVIPETYFVTIIEEVTNECYKVQYGNFVGYIKADSAIIASFTPQVKILEGVTCDIKDTSGTQIWNKPSAAGNVLTTIPAGKKNIKYIASAFGKIPSGGESNIWYYVSYTPESNSTNVYEGYIYSENVTNLTEIVPNTEANPEILDNGKDNDLSIINVSSPVKILLITLIAVPVVVLLLIIAYKLSKRLKSTKEVVAENCIRPNFNYNYENTQQYSDYPSQPLRREINEMSEKPYIRKIHRQNHSGSDYPVFPTYDSDDDLL